MKKVIVKDISQLEELAEKLLRNFSAHPPQNQATIILLSGDLGAGKTTLTQAIAKKIGIKEKVNSPTFTISKKYKISYNKSP
jgi:tRNA threonylcarbamoyladenosine biosynthesis protein TsaE